MKWIAVTLLAFAASAFGALASDAASVPDNAPEVDSGVLDILESLDDETLDALASKAEEIQQAQEKRPAPTCLPPHAAPTGGPHSAPPWV